MASVSRSVIGELSEVCRKCRLAAEVRQVDVATAAGVSHVTISRFEQGKQPEGLDGIVEAYEEVCEVEPLTLWRRAVERAGEA